MIIRFAYLSSHFYRLQAGIYILTSRQQFIPVFRFPNQLAKENVLSLQQSCRTIICKNKIKLRFK